MKKIYVSPNVDVKKVEPCPGQIAMDEKYFSAEQNGAVIKKDKIGGSKNG